ncbi:substrate-binding domain-containing protein, partial [Streptomyces sp. NPDC059447]|uniref:substrate-binding domain-containing protein n=1 Tax=Streptomyces sp. NPDC059447 TaxID=3346834 RepID=UPI00367F5301
LLEHLRDQGARHPALIIGAGTRHSAVDARAAYERAAAEQGWTPVVATAPEEGGCGGGPAGGAPLGPPPPAPDAAGALVDAFAVGAVRAIRDSGRRVPEDVMVVTRYDGPRARTCEPPLTAVDLQLDRAASEAVELLLARLRDEAGAGTEAAAGAAPAAAVSAPEPRVIVRASSLRVTAPE